MNSLSAACLAPPRAVSPSLQYQARVSSCDVGLTPDQRCLVSLVPALHIFELELLDFMCK